MSIISPKKKKQDLAIAYQALETLQMTTGTDHFGLRIVANFDFVIEKISQAVHDVKSPQFFDFVYEHVKKFSANFTQQNIASVLQALVDRILLD
jgi:hypothetical protein